MPNELYEERRATQPSSHCVLGAAPVISLDLRSEDLADSCTAACNR